MPSQLPPQSTRLPKATIDGAYGAIMTRVARRMWGQVPDNAYVLRHNKPVLKAVFGFEQKVGTWSALDPHHKTYAEMASADHMPTFCSKPKTALRTGLLCQST